jgi:2-polyprenyl-6-methoxyphenol hydroxylase-like FAD-dependent oxidoreductase
VSTEKTVVVAGAGPTGLLLAAELGRAGVAAVVVEPRARIEPHSMGMALHGRTLQVLEERGLAQELRDQGMFAWPRTPFGFLWLDLGVVGPEEHTYGFPQWRTEGVLEEYALRLGVDLRRGEEVAGFTQDGDGVTVTVRKDDGSEYDIRAAYLVGADGPDSTVRRLAGIALEDHEPSRYYGVLGDVELAEGASMDFDAGLHANGVFGAIPLGPDSLRLMTIEFEVPADLPAAQEPVALGELKASVGRITGKEPDVGKAVYLSRFGGQTTLADRFRDGRVLLAGDAAHTLFVSGTQGLNLGVQDAVNLGWKLAALLAGRAPEALLDSYEQERRAAARRAVTHARAAMAVMHPLEKVAPLREVLSELLQYGDLNRHLLTMTAEARYPAGDHPLTGTRLPHIELDAADGGTVTTAELLGTGRGLLLLPAGGDPEAAAAVGKEVSEGWADRIDVVTTGSANELPAEAVLVRPDGQIAFAGPAAEAAALRDALTTWFGPAG